jgi:hypothetical protein
MNATLMGRGNQLRLSALFFALLRSKKKKEKRKKNGGI